MYLLLTLSCSVAGQQPALQPPVDAVRTEGLRWLGALHDRFGQLHDPVVRVYAKAKLAALVCSQDKAAGTKQFREAFDDLRNLPDDAFDISPVVLPVDSFTNLWDVVATPARNCNSDVSWYDDSSQATSLERRKQTEWEKANTWLSEALGIVNRNPDRAAQLARAALSVSAGRSRQRSLAAAVRTDTGRGPSPGATNWIIAVSRGVPDLSSFVKVLIQLRVASPDLSDGLFQLATSAVMTSDPPSPAEFGHLATYLFPTETTVELADSFLAVLSERGVRWAGEELPAMPNFMAAELKGDRELATAFLASAVRLLQNYRSTTEDPAGAYALASQLLPKARELAVEHAGALEGALLVIEPLAGADAAKIRAKLGAAPRPRKVDYGSPEGDTEALGQACSDFKAGNYRAARAVLSGIAAAARAQVADLIQFAEAAVSLPKKDAEQILDREIYPDSGAKRSLLYAAIASATTNRTAALKAVTLGLKDAEPLTTGQRACILPALATAALLVGPDQAVAILRQMVAADNAITGNSGSGGAEASRDPSANAPDIRCRTTGPVELVNAPEGKLAFPLRPPGVAVFTISAFLEQARAVEFSQLESAVLELQDETHRVNGLLALAKLRFDDPSH
jgi:hypothetical protein